VEEKKQIGDSSLHVIASVERMDRSEDRMIWVSLKLLGFKIAHLDKEEKIIEGRVVSFEGEGASNRAEFLSGALEDLLERSYVGIVQMGSSPNGVKVVRSDNGALIYNDSAYVEVAEKDIKELANELGYVSALANMR
jgi:5-keto 4-deoxyuronate isomerase